MVKTHRDSRFVLYTLSRIRDCADIILQVNETQSIDTASRQSLYLCEVVNEFSYRQDGTLLSLSGEIVKLNDENRRLRRKVERLQKELAAAQKQLTEARP